MHIWSMYQHVTVCMYARTYANMYVRTCLMYVRTCVRNCVCIQCNVLCCNIMHYNATQCMYENGRVILSNGNQLIIAFWIPKIIKYQTHPSSKALIQIILFVSCIPLSFHRMVGEISWNITYSKYIPSFSQEHPMIIERWIAISYIP
jgi:hypothetical protein